MRSNICRLACLFMATLLAVASAAFAARDRSFDIKPGPTSILPEELALVADPARGIEHAIIIHSPNMNRTDWYVALTRATPAPE